MMSENTKNRDRIAEDLAEIRAILDGVSQSLDLENRSDSELTPELLKKSVQRSSILMRRLHGVIGQLSELGGFDTYLGDYGHYFPTAYFDKDNLRKMALEQIEENHADFDSLPDLEKEDMIEDYISEVRGNLNIPDYNETPGWWIESTC